MSLLRKIQIWSSSVTKLWTIDEANTARTTGTIVGSVQIVDQSGKVPPAGEAVGNAPFVKLTDGTNMAAIDAANTARTTGTKVQAVQIVDASGKVPPAGDVYNNAPFVKITDGSGSSPVDVSLHSLGVIDIAHKEIHEGNHFIASRIFTSVGAGAYADIRIKPGANYQPHMIFTVTADTAKATIELREACTFSGAGTALTAYNNDRGSINATTLANLEYAPTIDATGTLIYTTFIGSASTPSSRASSNSSSRMEFMLAKSTEYCLRVQNNHTGAQNICIELDWYEPVS